MLERIKYIDIEKGIGIVLMILCHCGVSDFLNVLIHSFHMPLFFLISGYLFKNDKERNYKIYVLTRIKKLIIPYCFFAFISYTCSVVNSIISHKHVSHELLNHIFWENTSGLSTAGSLWFLTALFIAQLVYFALNKIIDRTIPLGIASVTISLIGFFETTLFSKRLPLSMGPALVGVLFIYIGNVIRKNRIIEQFEKLNCICVLILAVCCVLVSEANGYANMREGYYSENIFVFIIVAVSSFVILTVISTRISENEFVLSYIGRNSIYFVGFNQIVIAIYKDIFYVSNSLLCAILTIFCISMFCFCFEKFQIRKFVE